MPTTPQQYRRPWGSLIGLLTASFVTLVGILSGLEPEIILQRAVLAAFVLGCLAAAVAMCVELMTRNSG